MSAETTNPITGTPVSVAGFGTPVYDDIAKLANIGVLPSTTPTTTNATSTGYQDITGVSLSYTKMFITSRLLVLLWTSGFADNATGATLVWSTSIGVHIDSTDYDVSRYTWNALGDHRQWSGGALLAGISAGSKTIQVRTKNDLASKRTTYDLNDRITMIVMELP